jgi:signal transduction histidine kinase/ActR/RegA family two-component response regulator
MNVNILIIDDDDQFRGSLMDSLEEEGFVITEADTIAGGVKILQENSQIQIIILDLHFESLHEGGQETGFDFLMKIRENIDRYKIIVYTAYERLLADFLEKINESKYPLSNYFLKIPDKNNLTIKFAVEKISQELKNEELNNQISKHLNIHNILSSNDRTDKQLKQLLPLICRYTLERIGSEGYTCHIRLLDWRTGDYELGAFAGPDNVETIFQENRNLNDSFSGEAAKEGKPLTFQELQTNEKFIIHKAKILSRHPSEEAVKYLNTVKSAYIVPIKTGLFDDPDQVEAVFNISSTRAQFFTNEKIEIIKEFTSHLQTAVSKYLLQTKRDEIHDDYSKSNRLLVEISEKLKDSNIKNVFDVVLKKIAEIINAEMVTIFLYNENTERLESRAEYAARGGDDIRYDTGESYEPGECLTGKVFKGGQPFMENKNPTESPWYESDTKIDLTRIPSRQLKHYLGIPLKVGDKTIGVIRANNKKSTYYDSDFPAVADNEFCLLSRGFSRDCQIILGIIANHLAVTIKNLELIEKQKETIKQLKTLTDVSQNISSNYGLENKNIFKTLVKDTARVMNTAVCMLFWKEPQFDRIVLKECAGIDHIPNCYYQLGEYITGKVAKDGEAVRQEKAKNYLGKYDLEILQELRKNYGDKVEINSYMIVPIVVWDDSPMRNNQIFGVLKVINKNPDHSQFTDDDLELFKTFASQISIAFAMSERNQSFFKLVQSVGHEINNTVVLVAPNASIQIKRINNFLELNKDNNEMEQLDLIVEVRNELNNIREAAEEARDFTDDLLGFSESKFRERILVDINRLIEKEVKKIQSLPPPSIVNEENVSVKFDFSETPLVCNIYEVPFAHIIRNIISNAYQAMEETEKGSLTIKTSRHSLNDTKEIACIKIMDTGKGIEASKLPLIFDSGFTEREGGNGLGLWLVKISLLRMKGLIEVESVVGKGSAFTITLPIP